MEPPKEADEELGVGGGGGSGSRISTMAAKPIVSGSPKYFSAAYSAGRSSLLMAGGASGPRGQSVERLVVGLSLLRESD